MIGTTTATLKKNRAMHSTLDLVKGFLMIQQICTRWNKVLSWCWVCPWVTALFSVETSILLKLSHESYQISLVPQISDILLNKPLSAGRVATRTRVESRQLTTARWLGGNHITLERCLLRGPCRQYECTPNTAGNYTQLTWTFTDEWMINIISTDIF